MKVIKLTKDKITLVDDEDYEELSKYKWHAVRKYGNKYYAVRTYNKRPIQMHRVIMKTPLNLVVDHLDGNPLNNQKSNLRNCTASDNAQNIRNRDGYQGVHWCSTHHKYLCYISIKGKSIHLGYFITEEAAALAYNEAALKYYGSQAKLNVIKDKEK
jgi:hypothetical protein